MKFYGLYAHLYHNVELRIEQLKCACSKLNIDAEFISQDNFDFSIVPDLKKQDLLYTIADGASFIETIFLSGTPTTFYVNCPIFSQASYTVENSIAYFKTNIKQPKTVFNITRDRTLLKKYVDFMNGFPLILKSVGSSMGIGTIKIESWQNLISTIDFLHSRNEQFIMREYIQAKSGCRLIVLGEEVIAGADFMVNKGDFRNAAMIEEIKYVKREYTKDLLDSAIVATKACNLQFAGLDFLEDINGVYYLLEVNHPTGFSGLIDVCNIDIPLKIVEFLKNKASI